MKRSGQVQAGENSIDMNLLTSRGDVNTLEPPAEKSILNLNTAGTEQNNPSHQGNVDEKQVGTANSQPTTGNRPWQ